MKNYKFRNPTRAARRARALRRWQDIRPLLWLVLVAAWEITAVALIIHRWRTTGGIGGELFAVPVPGIAICIGDALKDIFTIKEEKDND